MYVYAIWSRAHFLGGTGGASVEKKEILRQQVRPKA